MLSLFSGYKHDKSQLHIGERDWDDKSQLHIGGRDGDDTGVCAVAYLDAHRVLEMAHIVVMRESLYLRGYDSLHEALEGHPEKASSNPGKASRSGQWRCIQSLLSCGMGVQGFAFGSCSR